MPTATSQVALRPRLEAIEMCLDKGEGLYPEAFWNNMSIASKNIATTSFHFDATDVWASFSPFVSK
ncbi:MAG: hypothetical protein ACWA44_00795 [Thiotrichales bacterium]